MRGLTLDAGGDLDLEAFDRRLDPRLKTPIAVAFSGGGDSLAALRLTLAWATRHRRPVLALSVDHRLRAGSAEWTRFAGRVAEDLGAGFRALSWSGPKPERGLPAAARAARHRLIAEAARAAGAAVVVFGHTADDRLEAALMRAEGLRVGAPREWSPSPVWPEGRGLFILRPLLSMRRAAIRQALRDRGDAWIDDPANDDTGSARIRARRRLAGTADPPPSLDDNDNDDAAVADLARTAALEPEGFIVLDRSALRRAGGRLLRRSLAAGLLCAGGGERPPRGERLDRLIGAVLAPAPFQATLSGAKIIGDGENLLLTRDAGEARRGGLAPLDLVPQTRLVWDGRFEVRAAWPGLAVRGLGGLAHCLPAEALRRLRGLPPSVRPGLPAVVRDLGPPACPILAEDGSVSIQSLVGSRFLAACGGISKEPVT